MQIKATLRYPCMSSRCKMKRLTIQVGKEVETLGLYCIADGTVRWYNHCEKQFGNFLKGKILPTKSSNHSTLRCLCKRNKGKYIFEYLNIHISFVCNSKKKTQTTQMSINSKWVNKLYPYSNTTQQ